MVSKDTQPVTMAMMANEPGVADMILLDPVTEDQLLKNLEIRFKQSKIYVSEYHHHWINNLDNQDNNTMEGLFVFIKACLLLFYTPSQLHSWMRCTRFALAEKW